jgi:cytochrome P450
MIAPKPSPRPDKVSVWRYLRLFRQDILSAQPQRLYRAWMAEFKTPFFRSYLINQPDLIDIVLKERPDDFPKSNRIGEGLRPLVGNSVFLTNGEVWKRQRRIIDPAFEGGRLKEAFPAMVEAARAAVERLDEKVKMDGTVEVEEIASHAAADVIFRTLFSVPIEDRVASQVFSAFRDYQRTQPILNLAAFLPLPHWMPRFRKRETRRTARTIRALITQMTTKRQAEIADGTAPEDLATKIMTTRDPETGKTFTTDEMVDQVAIFFLAGHETSASALGWALYLVAADPATQEAVFAELANLNMTEIIFSDLSKMPFTRDVFRETLRLYPPVPMMVRETQKPEHFRNRVLPKTAQVVISPWHVQRHERFWDRPDAFDPSRWQTPEGRQSAREAYLPFSKGRRVCTGAGFAMAEGVVLLAMLIKAFRFETVAGRAPVPIAHLTVRSKDGIWLTVTPREVC